MHRSQRAGVITPKRKAAAPGPSRHAAAIDVPIYWRGDAKSADSSAGASGVAFWYAVPDTTLA